MPDIYDPERRIKISLTDDDFEDYKEGNLSDEFYARRKNGSIANRVDITPMDDDNDDPGDGDSNGGFDALSLAIGALIGAAIGGATRGFKKLWDRYKKKRIEAQIVEQRKVQNDLQVEENEQELTEYTSTALAAEVVDPKNDERKSLTQEEAIQEMIKILVGLTEMADGKKKVSEGIEKLNNAGAVDKTALLKILSDPKVLEDFNAYFEANPKLVMQNQEIFDSLFGCKMIVDGQYIPLVIPDVEREF